MELQLPKRKKPAPNSFNTSPGSVRRWVDDLPLLNTGLTRQLLDDTLDELNTLEIPAENRYTALELLATSVICVIDALRKQFLDRPLPLQTADRAAADQALKTCNRMATGYRILADDLGRLPYQESQLAVAIHRALRYLSELLLMHYQIYVPYPRGLWQAIHALYALAEECGVTTSRVTDPTAPGNDQSTVATVYKQILLLSLANPYRMRQKEIHFVYNALLDLTRFCRLTPAGQSRDGGLFKLDLQSDHAPVYRTLSAEQTTDKHVRILDTTAATGHLRDVLTAGSMAAGNHTGIGSIETLQQLMLAWGAMPRRKFPRHHQRAQISLVSGIHAIHCLGTASGTRPVEEDDAITDQHYLPDPTFDSSTRFMTPLEQADDLLRGAFSFGTQADARVETWRMADTSAGGYCLLWDNTFATSARVGELVAIAQPEDRGNRQLGVIRWMKFTGEYGLELGVQLLAPGGEAVWVYVCNDDFRLDPRADKRMQGILLPEIKALGQEASLLLPSLPFRTGCTSILERDGRQENIVLTRQLENTGCFAQFHFAAA